VSGPWVESVAVGTLVALGYEVIQVGIVPTPTVCPDRLRFTLQYSSLDSAVRNAAVHMCREHMLSSRVLARTTLHSFSINDR
jgi:hypothetical protein